MFNSSAWPADQRRLEGPETLDGQRGPIREALRKARDLHDLERAGESEWTPWLAILGLVVFFAVIESLILGLVEAAAHFIS